MPRKSVGFTQELKFARCGTCCPRPRPDGLPLLAVWDAVAKKSSRLGLHAIAASGISWRVTWSNLHRGADWDQRYVRGCVTAATPAPVIRRLSTAGLCQMSSHGPELQTVPRPVRDRGRAALELRHPCRPGVVCRPAADFGVSVLCRFRIGASDQTGARREALLFAVQTCR